MSCYELDNVDRKRRLFFDSSIRALQLLNCLVYDRVSDLPLDFVYYLNVVFLSFD